MKESRLAKGLEFAMMCGAAFIDTLLALINNRYS
jgi:hypothetical protein